MDREKLNEYTDLYFCKYDRFDVTNLENGKILVKNYKGNFRVTDRGDNTKPEGTIITKNIQFSKKLIVDISDTYCVTDGQAWFTLRKRSNDFWTQSDMGYHGDLDTDWVVAIAQTRDSECLERSNFECVRDDLDSEFGEDFVTVESFSHWAAGWVEYVFVKAFNEDGSVSDAGFKVLDILAQLKDYPVYNEDHFCELEYTEYSEYLHSEIRYMLDDPTDDLIDQIISEYEESNNNGYTIDCIDYDTLESIVKRYNESE